MWKVVVKLAGWLSMTGMCIFHSLDMARDWAIGEVERLESESSSYEGRLVMVIDELGV